MTCIAIAKPSPNCKPRISSPPAIAWCMHRWRDPMLSFATASKPCTTCSSQNRRAERSNQRERGIGIRWRSVDRAGRAKCRHGTLYQSAGRARGRSHPGAYVSRSSDGEPRRPGRGAAANCTGPDGSSSRRHPAAHRRRALTGRRCISGHARLPAFTEILSKCISCRGSRNCGRIGLANSYLAEGDTARAQGQLSLISPDATNLRRSRSLLSVHAGQSQRVRQEHQNVQALTAFAQAADAAGDDETANRELLQAGRDEGFRINRNLSFLSTFSVEPIFEDTTVYPLDAKLDVTNPIPGRRNLLPLPRSSLETQWTGAYHLHLGNSTFTAASSKCGMRKARFRCPAPTPS